MWAKTGLSAFLRAMKTWPGALRASMDTALRCVYKGVQLGSTVGCHCRGEGFLVERFCNNGCPPKIAAQEAPRSLPVSR